MKSSNMLKTNKNFQSVCCPVIPYIHSLVNHGSKYKSNTFKLNGLNKRQNLFWCRAIILNNVNNNVKKYLLLTCVHGCGKVHQLPLGWWPGGHVVLRYILYII